MTTCYFVSDLHGSEAKFKRLANEIIRNKPSFLFMGGDLLPMNRSSNPELNEGNIFLTEFLMPLFKNLQKQMGCNYPEVFISAGNDESKSGYPGFEQGVQKELWKFLNSSKARFGPYHIYGYSFVQPASFLPKDWEQKDLVESSDSFYKVHSDENGNNHHTLDERSYIKEGLKALAGNDSMDKAIFMFHLPPNDSLFDNISIQESIGSREIRKFINEMQPYITLHGHMYESSNVSGHWNQQFGRTQSFSAAYDGDELAIVIFQIDDPKESERKLISK